MQVRVNIPEKQRCPYCHDGLKGELIGCEACGAISHTACRQDHGACPAPGCGKPMKVYAPLPPTPTPANVQATAAVPSLSKWTYWLATFDQLYPRTSTMLMYSAYTAVILSVPMTLATACLLYERGMFKLALMVAFCAIMTTTCLYKLYRSRQ